MKIEEKEEVMVCEGRLLRCVRVMRKCEGIEYPGEVRKNGVWSLVWSSIITILRDCA